MDSSHTTSNLGLYAKYISGMGGERNGLQNMLSQLAMRRKGIGGFRNGLVQMKKHDRWWAGTQQWVGRT